jgi:transcriptional regulator with XRE-family HTH domain/mannose-6-phosphate isomerase-like protein (cupin superfamily)
MAQARNPGERIARIREIHKIDRNALAERSGLAPDLIARIEDEGYVPDLAPLVKIARALGVRLGTFMDDQEELGPVVSRASSLASSIRFTAGAEPPVPSSAGATSAGAASAGAASAGATPRAGLDFKALAAGKGGRHMEPFIVDVGGDSVAALPSTHEGEEFIHVLSGRIEVAYGKQKYELGEGDSIYYDSIVPHRVGAAGGKAARILAVVYAPF